MRCTLHSASWRSVVACDLGQGGSWETGWELETEAGSGEASQAFLECVCVVCECVTL